MAQPRLHSPLLPLPQLPDAVVEALVSVRGALAVLLLLGVATRWVALSGAALSAAARAGLVGGSLWRWSSALFGVQGLALAVAASELAIVLLLAVPRTRLLGIALALCLHSALGTSMVVSTFGVQMALYLLLFLPWSSGAARTSASATRSSIAHGA